MCLFYRGTAVFILFVKCKVIESKLKLLPRHAFLSTLKSSLDCLGGSKNGQDSETGQRLRRM